MIKYIDNILNRITMYRVMLYYITTLVIIGAILSFFKVLPYNGGMILFSALFITGVCWVLNKLCSVLLKAPTSTDSVFITAMIITLLIAPPASFTDTTYWFGAIVVSAIAIFSKFIFVYRKKHIFNPAAIGFVIAGFAFGHFAGWWVGVPAMMPFVLIGGLLMTRKLLRFDLVISFVVAALLMVAGAYLAQPDVALGIIWSALISTPLLFFAFVMLTEPATTPPTRPLRIIYGILVGILFAPFIHIGNIYSVPELALVVGNIFVFAVSPKYKLVLTLKEREQIAQDTYRFAFRAERPVSFKPGQYMEWTLPHGKPDLRGNRRYFTIASSPTEPLIETGIKFYPESSTFKNRLVNLKEGDTIVAAQLAGDFTMPADTTKKLVFVAGGIGVTPFRSMIKYMIDKNEKRDIVMLYSNKTEADVAYRELFDEATQKLGIKVIYNYGFLTKEVLMKEVPDYKDRLFYISGPQGMINAFEKMLKEVNVPRRAIKKDFFPGFA